MWRVQRSANGESVILALSGRIEADQLAELERLFEAEDKPLVLDLEELELVDREAVRFLAHCRAKVIRLQRCPAYVSAWIEREAG
jgi:anti-anti-sigma regulatory factor